MNARDRLTWNRLRDGVDFTIWQGPYFSTALVTIIRCLHDKYTTGKHGSANEAMKAFVAHWNAKHTEEK